MSRCTLCLPFVFASSLLRACTSGLASPDIVGRFTRNQDDICHREARALVSEADSTALRSWFSARHTVLPLHRPAAEAPAAADGPVDAYSAAASELATGAALEAKVSQVNMHFYWCGQQ